MAYSVVETTKGNDSGSTESEGKITLSAKRSWTIASSSEVGKSGVYVQRLLQNTGQLPRERELHPDHPQLLCNGVNVVSKTNVWYDATATYKSLALNPTDVEDDNVPWDTRAKVVRRSVTSTVEVDEDYDGKVIANPGTNEPVAGVMRPIGDVIAIIKQPFLVFSGPTIRNYMHQNNSDLFLGFPAGEGRVESIQAEEDKYGDIDYFNVTVEVLFRTPYQTTSEKAWYHRRALKGFYELVSPASGPDKIIRAIDDEKRFVTQPVYLDDSGRRLPDGDNPVFKETKLFGTIAYSTMGFNF